MTRTFNQEITLITWLTISLILYYIFTLFEGGYEGNKNYIYPLSPTKYTTWRNYVFFISIHLIFIIKSVLNISFSPPFSWTNRLSKILLFLIVLHLSISYLLFGDILIWKGLALINKPLIKQQFYLFPFYPKQWPLGWYVTYLLFYLIDLGLTALLYVTSKHNISKAASLVVLAFIVLILLRVLNHILYNAQIKIPFNVIGITLWIVFVIIKYMDPEKKTSLD